MNLLCILIFVKVREDRDISYIVERVSAQCNRPVQQSD